MRRGNILIKCLTVLFLIVPLSVMADPATENLESVILESFDSASRTTDWYVVGSRFVTEGFPKQTYTDAFPTAVFRSNPDNEELQVLGVNVKWDRKGYNNFEIIPVKKDFDGNIVLSPIPIPGRVKKLDLWVWCSNYDYFFEVHLKGADGRIHVLYMGSLAKIGWNNFLIDIPGHIVHTGQYGFDLKNIELVKFVVWTTPSERVNDFFIYFDQIKVLTDTLLPRFDGDNLATRGSVEEIWGED